MGRKRKTNKHLPQRVYWYHGAYRYKSKDKKWVFLGRTLSEMYKALSEMNLEPQKLIKVSQLIERYIKEIALGKAEKSYKENVKQSVYLKMFFGEMIADEVTPVDIYKYLDERAQKGKIAANREYSLLSNIFTYGIRWGALKINPCSGVRKFSEKRRDRNASYADFLAVLSVAKYPVNYAMRLALLMALRPGEVLILKKSYMLNEGFLADLTKTKKSIKQKLVGWNDSLVALVKEIINDTKKKMVNIDYLLCNKDGEPYTASGFATMWQRTMKKALADGLIEEPFQFRDIRHIAATTMERHKGREDARKFLGHASQNTTARYIDGALFTEALSMDIFHSLNNIPQNKINKPW